MKRDVLFNHPVPSWISDDAGGLPMDILCHPSSSAAKILPFVTHTLADGR
jgi:hypothetical protein